MANPIWLSIFARVTLLDRYVTREVCVATLMAVAVLSAVLILGSVFKNLLELLVNHDLPPEYIGQFIAWVLPYSLSFTIPWGFLTGVLLVFGRISAENELLAVKSSGTAVMRFAAPVFVLGVLLSGVCLWINMDLAPQAKEQMKNSLFQIATNNPLSLFGSDQVIDQFPGRRIYVGRRDGDQLENLHVFEVNDSGEPTRVVFARRGSIRTDLANRQVLMELNDVRYEQRDDNEPSNLRKIRHGTTMQEGTFSISLEELYKKNQRGRGLSQMTYKELEEAERTGGGQLEGLGAELGKRLSSALACIAFAMMGLPLAITTHRKETSVGFALSMGVAFLYFLGITVADAMRNKPELHPEWIMLVPPALFVALGGALLWRLHRH